MDSDFSKQKVLIVDDEPLNIKILGETLKQDYEIYAETGGERAVQVAENKQPDLILLDIVMPGMDGYQVLKKLKSNAATSKIPVIFITSRTGEEDEKKGFETGAVDYIRKPFSIPIVRARVKTHLELKRSRDILEHYAMYDGLTGLLTRKRFDDLYISEWRRCIRNHIPMTLIMIDIDYFKLYNDNYGHPAGDACLKAVAGTLSSVLQRSSDFLARYGGEEFVAVLVGTDADGASRMATTMIDKMNDLNMPHEYSPVADRVTISMGIASTHPEQKDDPLNLIKSADRMLYQAKDEGRNRFCIQKPNDGTPHRAGSHAPAWEPAA